MVQQALGAHLSNTKVYISRYTSRFSETEELQRLEWFGSYRKLFLLFRLPILVKRYHRRASLYTILVSLLFMHYLYGQYSERPWP